MTQPARHPDPIDHPDPGPVEPGPVEPGPAYDADPADGSAGSGPLAVEFVHRSWPAEAAALGHIRRELVAWIGPLGLAPDEVDDVVLAVDEAAANVVEHAYSPDDPGNVDLTLWTEPDALCIEITDHGTWTPTETPGRGIGLMQRMVGAVLIHVDERGSRVLLRHPLTDRGDGLVGG
ncbi:ATP-binding protein [Pseudonocardia sp.]|uniref:ATP-binding protein n=1 Tax=Pseudonocardia sp. TaxID=60912 RepID=UPI003D0B49CB